MQVRLIGTPAEVAAALGALTTAGYRVDQRREHRARRDDRTRVYASVTPPDPDPDRRAAATRGETLERLREELAHATPPPPDDPAARAREVAQRRAILADAPRPRRWAA